MICSQSSSWLRDTCKSIGSFCTAFCHPYTTVASVNPHDKEKNARAVSPSVILFEKSDSVLVRVSIALMKHRGQKSKLGRKGFIWLILPHHCSSGQELIQGRNVEAGAGAEDHQPRNGTTHNGLGSPMSIINQENSLQLNLWRHGLN